MAGMTTDEIKPLAAALWGMAGGDGTLPVDRPDPEREWAFPGFSHGRPVAHRCVGVSTYNGEPRTTYVLLSGYGYRTDVWHCFPKDQWTEAEAAEAARDAASR
jgi:hypothetical protein